LQENSASGTREAGDEEIIDIDERIAVESFDIEFPSGR